MQGFDQERARSPSSDLIPDENANDELLNALNFKSEILPFTPGRISKRVARIKSNDGLLIS